MRPRRAGAGERAQRRRDDLDRDLAALATGSGKLA